MGFLGHIISGGGVNPDPQKLQAMEEWPVPKTIKRTFKLIGYFKKFIKDYARISSWVTELLKKNAFIWSEPVQKSFLELKATMLSTLVLAYLDLEKEFVVETNACIVGIGVILAQEIHPICYYNCKLLGRMRTTSIYIKEIFAIYQVVGK